MKSCFFTVLYGLASLIMVLALPTLPSDLDAISVVVSTNGELKLPPGFISTVSHHSGIFVPIPTPWLSLEPLNGHTVRTTAVIATDVQAPHSTSAVVHPRSLYHTGVPLPERGHPSFSAIPSVVPHPTPVEPRSVYPSKTEPTHSHHTYNDHPHTPHPQASNSLSKTEPAPGHPTIHPHLPVRYVDSRDSTVAPVTHQPSARQLFTALCQDPKPFKCTITGYLSRNSAIMNVFDPSCNDRGRQACTSDQWGSLDVFPGKSVKYKWTLGGEWWLFWEYQGTKGVVWGSGCKHFGDQTVVCTTHFPC